MKAKKGSPMDYVALQPHKFLLLDRDGADENFVSTGGIRVGSRLSCLSRAIGEQPEIIVIRMGKGSLHMHEGIVELCTVLKRNNYTNSIPLLVLLHLKHRKLLEKLDQAGVELIKYCDDTPLDPEKTRRLMDKFQPQDLLPFQLERLCPFLNYEKIDAWREMTVCGAYLNRMVLGGQRLREICHTTDHHHCIYFLHPRDDS